MGFNNDLSNIKVSVNNTLILPLENKKINSLLIFGNTINFFGRLDNNGNLALNEMNDNDRNHFFWLLDRCQQKTKIYIIGEVEEKEYYERLFRNIYKNFRLKVYYKFLETTNDNPKGYLTYMKQFNNTKFDYIVGNPPFGSTGCDTLHLKCTDMVYDKFNKKMIIIMPYSFVTKDTKPSQKYRIKFSPKLQYVKEISGKNFEGTCMFSTAIYEFTNNETNTITIENISGEKTIKNDLSKISQFNKYEEEIIKYLDSNQQLIKWGGGHSHCTKKSLMREGYTDLDLIQKTINDNIVENSKCIPNEGVYMMINTANGGMNGTAISSKNGNIFTNYNDLINEFINRNQSTGYNVAIFKSVAEAENCKVALQNPLLRFTIYKTQNDQNMMINRVYKYIPAVDWEDSRCLTDEGLLEICGCPSDKAKEYAEYVKNYVETRDKEIESRKKCKRK